MIKTSPPGKNEGYALLDALVGVLVVSLIAGALLPGLGLLSRLSRGSFQRAEAAIQGRNANAILEIYGADE